MNTCQPLHTRYLSCLLWCGTFFLSAQPIYTQISSPPSYSGECHSFIRIRGESNISTFSFRYNTSAPADTWQNTGKRDTGFFAYTVPVRDFEASNPLMYDDFLALIKAREFPVIRIILPKEPIQRAFKAQQASCPAIEIVMAGVARTYKIDCNLYGCGENIYIRGLKTIKLSDFNIKAPVKLSGLVKVKDEIEVNFGLIVTFDTITQTTALR